MVQRLTRAGGRVWRGVTGRVVAVSVVMAAAAVMIVLIEWLADG